MIFTAASALLIAATSVAAAPGLSLKISGPAQVNNVDNLAVVATIVNTGDETLKLFNDPRGTLSSVGTNSFAITSASGDIPKFIGLKAKYGFDAAAKSGDARAFTILAPGQSIDVTHDLSNAYSFNSTGTGAYTIEPSKLFHYLDAAGKANEIYAHVTDAHTASLTGKLVSSKLQARSGHRKRAFTGCSPSQQSQIKASIPGAESYVQDAYSYLTSHTSGTTRFTTWFGTYTKAHHDRVQSNYNKILNNSPAMAGYSFDCTCTDPGTFAQVNPSNFGVIELCGAFWTAPTTGTNSKAGTIVHESTHFTRNGGTDDLAYGHADCQALARSKSNSAVVNADSHEFFAENSPDS